jgi:hypothetical protein
MGMIPGTFIVTDNIDNAEQIKQQTPIPTKSSGGMCGGSSGGCGCGMM